MSYDKRNFLPTPPADMMNEHLRNAIRFHLRKKTDAMQQHRYVTATIDGHNYALGHLLAERLRRREGRRQAADDTLTRRKEAFETYVQKLNKAPDTSLLEHRIACLEGRIAGAERRNASLETSNQVLAAKVEKLSRRPRIAVAVDGTSRRKRVKK